ncbi:MAG: bifunctional response regulator/alkaline phosphatase family protein [candidate division WOR-3 bacterium]|nr:bifunctional response regulator/alkaline phosphatase family protein [candidate division WOR-3 bacterium]MCX7947150.1 bifunctional response regulator/alkaline phosphatase family protein [candidate division WOR-3 bacterium]MDW8150206.1 response regulator [candidate division WOR-3 bacterium]
MRILWIDDEIYDLKSVVELLEKEGFSVDIASSGLEGLEKIKNNTYDFILLDYKMPHLDGIETLKLINSIKPNIPIIMLTMITDREIIEKAMGNDVYDYIIKPVNVAQIIAISNKIKKEEIKRKFLGIGLSEVYSYINSIEDSYENWIKKAKLLFETRVKLNENDREIIDMEIESQNQKFAKWLIENYKSLLKNKTFSHNLFMHKFLNYQKVSIFIIDAFRIDQMLLFSKELPSSFNIEIDFYYSIIPTSTIFSRNSIFSGRLPIEIYKRHPDYLNNNLHEIELFDEFLRENKISSSYRILKINHFEEVSKIIPLNRDIEINVINFLDEFLHQRMDIESLKSIKSIDTIIKMLNVMLIDSKIVQVIEKYLNLDYVVFITTDHGWIVGKKPIAISGGSDITEGLRFKFGDSLRFMSKDGYLIKELEEYGLPRISQRFGIADGYGFFVYKSEEHKFAKQYENYFMHGGITLEEVICPILKIRK